MQPANKIKAPQVVLALSVAFLVVSVGVFLNSRHAVQVPTAEGASTTIVTGMTERDMAIQQAIKEGKSTYSYTSHFMPGSNSSNSNGGK